MNPTNVGDPLQLLDVSCNHCGAPLSLAANVNFATCAHCGSRLQIHHAGGASYSEVLGSIDQRTQRIERDVAAIKASEDAAALDREWATQKQNYLVNDGHGNQSIPTTAGSIGGGIFVIIFGIIWTVGAASSNAPALFPLFGIAFVCFGIFRAVSSANKAQEYKAAQQQYQTRRDSLSRQNRR